MKNSEFGPIFLLKDHKSYNFLILFNFKHTENKENIVTWWLERSCGINDYLHL